MKVTAEDIRMVRYFGIGKGDLDRWAQYEERRDALREEFPELMDAFGALKKAESDVYHLMNVAESKFPEEY